MKLEELMLDMLNNACGNFDQMDVLSVTDPAFNGRMRYTIETHCVGYTVTATPPRHSDTGAWVIHSVDKYDR